MNRIFVLSIVDRILIVQPIELTNIKLRFAWLLL